MMDIKATDCIEESIRMDPAEYRGIPTLPIGGNSLHRNTVVATFNTNGEKGGGNDSESDTFSEELLAKCGINLGDRLYKPKHKNGDVLELGPNQRQSPTSMFEADLLGSQSISGDHQLDLRFSSLLRAICHVELVTSDSYSSDWAVQVIVHVILYQVWQKKQRLLRQQASGHHTPVDTLFVAWSKSNIGC